MLTESPECCDGIRAVSRKRSRHYSDPQDPQLGGEGGDQRCVSAPVDKPDTPLASGLSRASSDSHLEMEAGPAFTIWKLAQE